LSIALLIILLLIIRKKMYIYIIENLINFINRKIVVKIKICN